MKQPWQYSTWNDTWGRRNAQRNLDRFGEHITSAIDDYYSGKLQAPTPLSTHYWAPATMRAIYGYSHPKWHPQIKDRSYVGPHLFGTDKSLMDDVQRLHIERIIKSPELGAPVPTGRGVSLSEHLASRLKNNTEPPWSSQFAPGGGGLLGAEPIAPQAPLEDFGPPASRSDFPTGPTDPAPWVDDFAPAPAYPPRMASRERFEKTFAQPDPHAPVLRPGMSDRARAVAMRDLADRMARAGVAGLDGRRMAAQSAENEGPGLDSVESGMPSAPHTYDPGTLHRVPTPKARPGGYRPMPAPVPRRRPVAPDGVVPVPTARPEPMGWPTPSTVPVPTPAPRRGAGLVPTRGAIAPLGPYASGPKKQIFDFVLGKLLNPGRPAN